MWGGRDVLIDNDKTLPPCILHSSGRSLTKTKLTKKQETAVDGKLCEAKINMPELSTETLPLNSLLKV